MQFKKMMMKQNKTGYYVSGLGLMVTGLGRVVGGRIGDAMSGFGMAHIVLGIADAFRD